MFKSIYNAPAFLVDSTNIYQQKNPFSPKTAAWLAQVPRQSMYRLLLAILVLYFVLQLFELVDAHLELPDLLAAVDSGVGAGRGEVSPTIITEHTPPHLYHFLPLLDPLV